MTATAAPRTVGLVADDLTGAADAAVAFAAAGWRAEIDLAPPGAAPASRPRDDRPALIAVSSEARAMSDEEASAATASATLRLRQAGAERLYLKIDSTVRGSVAAQVTGARQAWSVSDGARGDEATALICPAFPRHDRVVHDGHVLVAGRPVHLGPAGLDPVTPVTGSFLPEIVPGARLGEPGEAGVHPLLVVDAESEADLDRVAAAVAHAPAGMIAVGSGGLAGALARRWDIRPGSGSPARALPRRPRGRVLIAVSSQHPVSTAQIAHTTTRLDAGDTIVTTGPHPYPDPASAAAQLAHDVHDVLGGRRFAALVLVGGDGAAAVLRRLGAERLVLDGEIVPGCPQGVLIGGDGDGLTVVTKSGGFGSDATLTRILDLLTRERAEEPVPRTEKDHT